MTDNIQYSIFDGPLQALVNENTRSDNWVNATKWCQYYKKQWNAINKQSSFKNFIKAVEEQMGLTDGDKKLTYSTNKGRAGSETWIHPAIAIKLATRLDPKLEVAFALHLSQKKDISTEWIKENGTPKEKDLSGFVYLVQATKTNFYKIGLSKDPLKRLSSIQTGTPFEVKIIHRLYSLNCVLLEKALHDYYQAYWLRGEWFDFPVSVVKEFVQTANDLDQSIESNLLTGAEN